MASQSESYCQLLDYDPAEYPFAETVSSIFDSDDLSTLGAGDRRYGVLTRESDQSTAYHSAFYARVADLLPTYERFVRAVIAPLFAGESEIVYQRVPTFRIHLPDNLAVGTFHRDTEFGHSVDEQNFWLPITSADGSNSIWIESRPNKGDYRPMRVRYGQVLHFDAARLMHGNRLNESGRTRLSLDFRVIPGSRYRPRADAVTVNTRMSLSVGGYFTRLQLR